MQGICLQKSAFRQRNLTNKVPTNVKRLHTLTRIVQFFSVAKSLFVVFWHSLMLTKTVRVKKSIDSFFHADHPFFYSEFIFEAKKHVTSKESAR